MEILFYNIHAENLITYYNYFQEGFIKVKQLSFSTIYFSSSFGLFETSCQRAHVKQDLPNPMTFSLSLIAVFMVFSPCLYQ